MQAPRVLLITDASFPDETVLAVLEAAGRALPAGEFAVQLRDKARSRGGRAAWARILRDATAALEVPLVVNRDARLAREVGADGVHYGREASPTEIAAGEGLWRSAAAHDDRDVEDALAAGLDAVLVSPVFTTPGKGPARGVGPLARAAGIARGRLAVFALGGVSVAGARACFEAGADGVAVIRALLAAPDPADVARALWRACAVAHP